ncbi:MAG: histidine phosphatase family protein [Candidatus Paceibacterota bacterium]|jgi:hypothetical protein
MGQEKPSSENREEKGKFSADYIRHSTAQYKTYEKIMTSDNPMAAFNPNEQIPDDLTEEGKELARQEAVKYFSSLDPQKTKLFFVSSNEVRTRDTAKIFLDTARAMGFEIVHPESPDRTLGTNIDHENVRILDSISLNLENMVCDDLFSPAMWRRKDKIKWDKLPPDMKEKYEQGEAIVDADDQGSWLKNYVRHGDSIKAIFPQLKTYKEMGDAKFRRMMRLVKFGEEKFKKDTSGKNIKVLAFSHDGLVAHFLQENFGEAQINNCEVLGFAPTDENMLATFRGQTVEI